MLCAIVLANTALDESIIGEKQTLSAEMNTQLTEYVVSALKADDNIHYLVAAIQLLFRVNEISSALFLINNNLSLVSNSAPVLKILLLICLMENDFQPCDGCYPCSDGRRCINRRRPYSPVDDNLWHLQAGAYPIRTSILDRLT